MFNFGEDTISDSATIANSIYQSYYPEGRQVVKNTSYYSKDFGNQLTRERSLTTRSLADALSGDVLYRSPKFSTTFYNKGLSSSLNSLLTGGSEAAFASGGTYKINNPEDIGDGSSAGSATLSGGAAFSRVLVDGVIGKNAASEFVTRAANSISNDYSTSKSYPASSSETGTQTEANPTTAEPAAGNPSGGAREVVLDASISSEEKTWLLERANKLKSLSIVSDYSGLISGYNFDIPNGITDISSTKSHFPGTSDTSSVSSTVINAGVQKAYAAPVMIELLIYLSTKIKITGGFGFQRGTGNQGPNLTALQSGSSISDHPFGRAFDISSLGTLDGSKNVNLSNEGNDATKHRTAVDILLTALNTAPTHLIPDLIVISPEVGSTLGIGEDGFESNDTKVKQDHPGLKYVNFSIDANHRTHIHISFSAARAGIYSGPGGQMGGASVSTGGSRSRSLSTSRTAALATPTPDGEKTDTSTQPTTDPSTGPGGSGPMGFNFLSYIRQIRSNNPFAPKTASTTTDPATGNPGTTAPGDYVIPSNLNDPKFTKNYSTEPTTALDIADIYALLRLTIMSDEAAALFAAIAEREGGRRPGAFLCLDSSGDWSFGLWGINMLPTANGTKNYSIPYPNTKQALGWQLAYKDWQTDDIDASNFRSKAFQKLASIGGKNQAGKLWDPVVWVPINQAYILATVITGQPFSGAKLGQVAESSYLFFPWGDYGGGPTWGWISNVKFSTALNLYKSTGKSEADLKKWVLDMFKGAGAKSDSAPYAEKWVEGYMYTVQWRGGWTNATIVPPS